MTEAKLLFNLQLLSRRMPVKPAIFTTAYPKSVKSALQLYLRSSTVNNIRTAAWIFECNNWPLPLYGDKITIRLGKLNRFVLFSFTTERFYYYDFIRMYERNDKPKRRKPGLVHNVVYSLMNKKWIEHYDYLNIATINDHFQIMLQDVLQRIADHPINKIQELLPHHYNI